MHHALFIDEILQEIFEAFALGQDALFQAMRCCRAWKDPACDRLWRHLSGVAPLLALIPGIELRNGNYVILGPDLGDLTAFRLYANRVQHISHIRDICIDAVVLSRLICGTQSSLLPNLASAHISLAACQFIRPSLSLSQRLQRLDLDLGFKSSPAESSPVCEYLEELARIALGIEYISLRGLLCERLNLCISSMTNLRVLSLGTGTSLTAETLAAIARFPFITNLDVQCGHIHVDSFIGAIGQHPDSKPFFTSLKKLHIRATSPLVETILQLLQPGTLRTLRIEAQDMSSPINWSTIFALIRSKAAQSLLDLFIEHHIDIEDIDDTPGTPITIPNHPHSVPPIMAMNHINLATLRPLANLRSIQRITLDMSIPPDLCDTDIIECVARWWPDVEHLDLGTFPVLEHIKKVWRPRTTFACLAAFAMYAPKLQGLILPLDVSGAVDIPNSSAFACMNLLRRLTVGSSEAPSVLIGQRLRSLFPFLKDVDGAGEHVSEWDEVQSTLHALPSALLTSTVT